MNKRIVLDADGVLWGLKAINIASELFGMNYKEEHATDWNLTCFPEELRTKTISLFSDPITMCDKVKIITESQQRVRKWYSEGYQIHVITARMEPIRFKTVELISIHFPEVVNTVFVDFNESKSAALNSINPILFVDDNPRNIEDGLELGIDCIMVSNKYTQYNHSFRSKTKWVNNLMEIK